jgi:hypothetical protein
MKYFCIDILPNDAAKERYQAVRDEGSLVVGKVDCFGIFGELPDDFSSLPLERFITQYAEPMFRQLQNEAKQRGL